MKLRLLELFLILLFVTSCSTVKKVDENKINKSASGVEEKVKAKSISNLSNDNDVEKKRVKTFIGKKNVHCRFVQDERVIKIRPLVPKGCEVLYTKYGKTEIKGTAVNELEVCDRVLNKIAGNLNRAGFICEDE